jgi:CRP-like cAMP-binding protein
MVNPETTSPIPNRSRVLPPAQPEAGNLLLTRLSAESVSELRDHLAERSLGEGTVIWHAGEMARHVIFPISGTLSIRVPIADGHGIEVGVIGPEAAIGFEEALGAFPAATQVVVQCPGSFALMTTQAFGRAARDNDELSAMAAACTRWLLLQSQQIAACNAAHSANDRFCWWLLRASDCAAQEIIPVTQETMAQALGIRRTTATLIAQELQAQGVISYRRGKIVVRDRARLEVLACDCHSALGRTRWPSERMRARSAPRVVACDDVGQTGTGTSA